MSSSFPPPDQPPPPPAYQPPPDGGFQPGALPPPASGMAITSLVLGILSFLFSVLTGLPAIILGILSLNKAKANPTQVGGSGLAVAGMVTGGAGSLISIGCAAALLLPAVNAARDAARRNLSISYIKNISLAMATHHDARGRFPSPAVGEPGSQLSWRVHILPYIEEAWLYEQFHLDEPWDSPHNLALLDQMPEIYASPSADVGPGETVYLLVTGEGTAFRNNRAPTYNSLIDGSSKTAMLVEANESEAVPWTKPSDWRFRPADPMRGLGGLHRRVWLVGFFDCHVRAISNDEDPEVVRALMTNNGGETIELP